MSEPRRLVLVRWVDSFGVSSNWREIGECAPDVLTCQSVGWLLHDAADCKVIVPHLAGSEPDAATAEQGCGDMTIPTAAILSIVELQARV